MLASAKARVSSFGFFANGGSQPVLVALGPLLTVELCCCCCGNTCWLLVCSVAGADEKDVVLDEPDFKDCATGGGNKDAAADPEEVFKSPFAVAAPVVEEVDELEVLLYNNPPGESSGIRTFWVVDFWEV